MSAKIAQALLAAQREFPPIAKSAVNPFFKSSYAPLDAVLAAVVPVLNKHGIALTQSVTTPDRNEHGAVTSITIVTTLLHESGESITSPVVMPLAKSDPQGAGGAITFGRRYGLQLAVGVTGEEDDDGNHASKPAAKPPSRPAKAANPAKPASGAPEDYPMPMGKHKGTPLGQMETSDLQSAVAWCMETDAKKFESLIDKMNAVLDARTNL